MRRFRTLHDKSPRINDIPSFLNDLMGKVQALPPTGIIDVLFRAFYYDCRPYGESRTDPNGKVIDFSQFPQFRAANAFQNDLRTFPQMALRLGDLSFDGWEIDPKNPKRFIPDFKQKAVDMKIGLDIAWMSSKRTIDKLVLVAGDDYLIGKALDAAWGTIKKNATRLYEKRDGTTIDIRFAAEEKKFDLLIEEVAQKINFEIFESVNSGESIYISLNVQDQLTVQVF